jgi:hypothetical protein
LFIIKFRKRKGKHWNKSNMSGNQNSKKKEGSTVILMKISFERDGRPKSGVGSGHPS